MFDFSLIGTFNVCVVDSCDCLVVEGIEPYCPYYNKEKKCCNRDELFESVLRLLNTQETELKELRSENAILKNENETIMAYGFKLFDYATEQLRKIENKYMSKTHNTVVSANLKRLLKEAKVTQEDLAKELGVHQTLISQWCCGKTTPTIRQVSSLSEFLKIPVEDIIKCFKK